MNGAVATLGNRAGVGGSWLGVCGMAGLAGWAAVGALADPRLAMALCALALVASGFVLGPRRIVGALACVGFGGVVLLTAVRHAQELAAHPPSPFYTISMLRVTLPEMLLGSAWLAALACTRDLRSALRTGPVPLFILGFLLWGLAVGVVRGDDVEASIRDGRKLTGIALAHAAVVALSTLPGAMKRLSQTVGLAASGCALALLLRFARGEGFEYGQALRATVDVADFVVLVGLLCLPIAMVRTRALSVRSPSVGLATGIAVLALFSTGSRAAVGAVPVALGVTCLWPLGTASRRRLSVLLLVLAIAALCPFLWSDLADNTLERVAVLSDPASDPSVQYRLREITGAASVVAEHPFAGTGFGVPFDVGQALVDRREADRVLVHNLGFWVAIKGGLPGVLLFAALLVLTVRSLRSTMRRGHSARRRGIALGLLAVLAGLLTMGTVGALLNQARVTLLLGLLTGLAHVLWRETERRAESHAEPTS